MARDDLKRLAAWMRSGQSGTFTVNGGLDVNELLDLLGGSPTARYPHIWVDSRQYTLEPADSGVLVTLHLGPKETPP